MKPFLLSLLAGLALPDAANTKRVLLILGNPREEEGYFKKIEMKNMARYEQQDCIFDSKVNSQITKPKTYRWDCLRGFDLSEGQIND